MKNEKTADVEPLDAMKFTGSMGEILLDKMPCIALIMKPSTKEVLVANRMAREWGVFVNRDGAAPCFWRIEPQNWAVRSEQQYEFEMDGLFWDAHWIPFLDDLVLFYAFDVSDRKRSETIFKNTLQGLEGYRKIFMQMPEAAFIVSPDGVILDVNDAALQQLGYRKPELIGRPVTHLYDDDSHEVISNGSTARNEEVVIRTKDNMKRTVLLNRSHVCADDGKVIHTVSLQNDITDIKRHEEEHLRCSKLESLGQLAGGIAHDFNNLLGGIYGYIDLAGAKTGDERVIKYLGKALSTIERAKSLTRQLLTFAKGGAPVKHLDSLFPFVKNRAEAVLADTGITFTCVVGEPLWQCECDRNQIGQVIEDLVTNAVQAMPDGGHLFLEASNLAVEHNSHTLLNKGKYLQIIIKDTGVGIPATIRPHLFDPFYSTKPKCRGLGLATCYSIISKHGGCIEVESKPGEGSIFTVYLPAAVSMDHGVTKPATTTFAPQGLMVVVDDEEIMRETIGEMLVSLGYTVVLKEEGQSALEYIDTVVRAGEEIAGVIVDLTIPGGLGGKEVMDQLRSRNCTIPVLVSSGYAEDPVMADPHIYGFTASIAKPFRRDELLKILKP